MLSSLRVPLRLPFPSPDRTLLLRRLRFQTAPFGVFLGIFLREIRCDSLSVALGSVVIRPSASRAAPLATGLRLGFGLGSRARFGLLRILLLEVLPNHRGRCLIVAVATDENDVSLILKSSHPGRSSSRGPG